MRRLLRERIEHTERPLARVEAKVMFAGNVQTQKPLMPYSLAATLLPVTTFVVVTEPLGDKLHRFVRYQGGVSDTDRADNHFRIVGGDRLTNDPGGVRVRRDRSAGDSRASLLPISN